MGNSIAGRRSVHERLFLDWSAGRVPRLYTDEFRQVCTSENLAEAMVELCERDDFRGVFHWAGADLLSRYEIGRRIREHFKLAESQAPRRLVCLTNALFGWLPGGLAIVSVCACTLFTAFTGATGVTLITLGAVLYPALRQAHYDERFSLGLLTAAGSLGLLLVPSMPLILYGVVAQQFHTTPPVSIDALFKAGLLPCLLMVVMLSIYSAWKARDLPRPPPSSAREVWAALKDAAWELPLPFVILIGIYTGKLAASEAAHRATDRAMQIMASAGYRRGSTIERLFRDVRATEIYQGTSEAQRLIIAQGLLADA